MDLPLNYSSVVKDALDRLNDGDLGSASAIQYAVERCYALANKPKKELTDAEIDGIWVRCGSNKHIFARAIEAAHIAKQHEPEKVKFRAARRKGANYPEMLVATDTLNPNWEWLDYEGKPQEFEVRAP